MTIEEHLLKPERHNGSASLQLEVGRSREVGALRALAFSLLSLNLIFVTASPNGGRLFGFISSCFCDFFSPLLCC